jgi:hypothetical protein
VEQIQVTVDRDGYKHRIEEAVMYGANAPAGGQLNADWVELLMGFDVGYTDIDCASPIPWPGWPAPLGAGNWPTPSTADRASEGTGEAFITTTGTVRRRNHDGSSSNLGLSLTTQLTTHGQHPYEPPRVITGQKNRAKRLKCLGNAVVPQQIYPIFAAIKAVEEAISHA